MFLSTSAKSLRMREACSDPIGGPGHHFQWVSLSGRQGRQIVSSQQRQGCHKCSTSAVSSRLVASSGILCLEGSASPFIKWGEHIPGTLPRVGVWWIQAVARQQKRGGSNMDSILLLSTQRGSPVNVSSKRQVPPHHWRQVTRLKEGGGGHSGRMVNVGT